MARRHRTPASPAHGRRAALSQNFLHRPAALRLVVRAAAVEPGALVVEPGAGQGALTRALAPHCRRILAYELDPTLAARLPHELRGHDHARVVHGDFLCARPPRAPFAVVGNIPYSRTAAIVRWCLAARQLTSATLVTQREYARKRTGDYGRWTELTVSTWPEHHWRLAGRIDRTSFTPVPRTDSAVLRLERRPEPLLPAHRLPAYRAFVAHGFTGVGGSLAATLARHHGRTRVRAAFHALDLDPALPVGFFHPGDWLALFTHLHRG